MAQNLKYLLGYLHPTVVWTQTGEYPSKGSVNERH